MSVNGITSNQSVSGYSYVSSSAARTKTAESTSASSAAESTGVVYESSQEAVTNASAKTYTPDVNLVNKLKADADERTSQLRSMVEKLMTQQAGTYNKANDIWSFLRDGNFKVDPETKAQAQKDISEDGYFGVKQTSDRIIEFAKALTGGDPSKVEKMRSAFEKGFKQAEKVWGGQLPEISQQTYKSVMDKFDELAAGNTAT